MRTKPATRIVLALILTCLALLAPFSAVSAEQGTRIEAELPSDYLIGPEDVIEISVWKNEDLSKTVTVRPDGRISLPLVGDLQAAGLTPVQLKDNIIIKLKEYQETAVVSVIVESISSYKVFVMGEVRVPGVYLLKTNTSVLQAIALAGGFSQYASKNKMVLIRKEPDGAGEKKFSIRFDDLIYAEGSDKNLILKPGDTIFVP